MSCQSTPTRTTAINQKIKYIPCESLKAIDYSGLLSGQVESAENSYDSSETITQIREYNAVYDALCIIK